MNSTNLIFVQLFTENLAQESDRRYSSPFFRKVEKLTIFDQSFFEILLRDAAGTLIVKIVDIESATPGQLENLIHFTLALAVFEIEKIALIRVAIFKDKNFKKKLHWTLSKKLDQRTNARSVLYLTILEKIAFKAAYSQN